MPILTNFLVRPQQPRTRPFNVCDDFYAAMCTGFQGCTFSVFSICKSLQVDMNNEQKMYLGSAIVPWARIERELSVCDHDKYVDVEEHGFPLCRQVWRVYNGYGDFDSRWAWEGEWREAGAL